MKKKTRKERRLEASETLPCATPPPVIQAAPAAPPCSQFIGSARVSNGIVQIGSAVIG